MPIRRIVDFGRIFSAGRSHFGEMEQVVSLSRVGPERSPHRRSPRPPEPADQLLATLLHDPAGTQQPERRGAFVAPPPVAGGV